MMADDNHLEPLPSRQQSESSRFRRYSCILPDELYGSQISPVLRPIGPRLSHSSSINHSSKPGHIERALSRIGSIHRRTPVDRCSEDNVLPVVTTEIWLPERMPLSMESLRAALDAIPDLEEDNTSQSSTYATSLKTPSTSVPSASTRGSLAELRHQYSYQSSLRPHRKLPNSRARRYSVASSLRDEDDEHLAPSSSSPLTLTPTPTPSQQPTTIIQSPTTLDIRFIPQRSYSSQSSSRISAIDRSPTPTISPRVSSLRHLKRYNKCLDASRDGTPTPSRKRRREQPFILYESVNGTSLGMSERGKLKSTRRIPGIVAEEELQIDYLRMTSPIAELEDDDDHVDDDQHSLSAPAPPAFGPRDSVRRPYRRLMHHEPVLHDPDALDIMNFSGFDSIVGDENSEAVLNDDDFPRQDDGDGDADFTGWQIRIESDHPERDENIFDEDDSDNEFAAEPPTVALYRSPTQQQQNRPQLRARSSSFSLFDESSKPTIRDMLREKLGRRRRFSSSEGFDGIYA